MTKKAPVCWHLCKHIPLVLTLASWPCCLCLHHETCVNNTGNTQNTVCSCEPSATSSSDASSAQGGLGSKHGLKSPRAESENSQLSLDLSSGNSHVAFSRTLTLSKLPMLPMLPKRPRIRLAPWWQVWQKKQCYNVFWKIQILKKKHKNYNNN